MAARKGGTAPAKSDSFDAYGTDAYEWEDRSVAPRIHDLVDEGPLVGLYQEGRDIETTDPEGNPRLSRLHTFATPEGEVVGVWGSWQLDTALEDVEPGTPTRLEFLSKDPIQGGRRSVKRYRIQTAVPKG